MRLLIILFALTLAAQDPNTLDQARAQIARITADSTITLDVASSGASQPPSVVLPFYPPGSGTPVRYWRLEIAFRRLDRLEFPLVVSGAFY